MTSPSLEALKRRAERRIARLGIAPEIRPAVSKILDKLLEEIKEKRRYVRNPEQRAIYNKQQRENYHKLKKENPELIKARNTAGYLRRWEKYAKYKKEYYLRHKDTAKYKEMKAKSLKKYVERYPEKDAARRKFSWACRSGKIKRPAKCEKCLEKKKVEGHHEDYSKPFDVVWLCKECHAKDHRKYNPPPHH